LNWVKIKLGKQRKAKEEGRWTREEGGPRLNSLRSFSTKNLTGQAEDRDRELDIRF